MIGIQLIILFITRYINTNIDVTIGIEIIYFFFRNIYYVLTKQLLSALFVFVNLIIIVCIGNTEFVYNTKGALFVNFHILSNLLYRIIIIISAVTSYTPILIVVFLL